jgi:hypothetical protein
LTFGNAQNGKKVDIPTHPGEGAMFIFLSINNTIESCVGMKTIGLAPFSWRL